MFSNKMSRVKCLFLAICCGVVECSVASDSGLSLCPTWMYRNNAQCTCGDDLQGAVSCITGKHKVKIIKKFCTIFDGEDNSTLIGTCPYSGGGMLPYDNFKLKTFDGLCYKLHREGPLCGACKENYSLPVYSYYYGCVKCEDYKYGWIKFIAAAFLPLTLFYITVIVFRISSTSSTLNGFVLVSQIVAAPSVIQLIYFHNQVNPYYRVTISTQLFVDAGIAVYAIWNLDFFRSFYKYICLYPDLKYQHVLLLDYAVALYPLLLILLTFICVKMHDNFAIVVWLWSPFNKCFVRFRKQWNVRRYLVDALATFIVLSYVKILNVSFQFLISSSVYNIKGQLVSKGYWYYDGRVDMSLREYLPYLMLAVSMLLFFNILPLALLFLYPFKCFQRFLDCCPCVKYKLALRLFMDAFYGCYKDSKENDCRHFAAIYLAGRFLNLLLLSVLRSTIAYFTATSLLYGIGATLVAKYKPYKCDRSNTVDIVLLLTLLSFSVMASMALSAGLLYPKWVLTAAASIVALIPPSCVALACVKPKVLRCFTKSKRYLLERMSQNKDASENSVIANQARVADYSSFTN